MDGPIFTWKRLKERHPRYSAQRLRVLHALYRGGHHLLCDEQVMQEVFPRHAHEQDPTYWERRKRAFYENLFALVINYVSAGLAQDPARLAPSPEDSEPDPYWSDLVQNAAPPLPTSERRTLDQVLRAWAVEALVCGWAWLQCDLPDLRDEVTSLAEQERAGALRAYPCLWPTDYVVDWSEKSGNLQWLRTYECRVPDDDPTVSRTAKVHCYTLWTATGWWRYEVLEDTNPARRKDLPRDEQMIQPTASGAHSFGCVPWVRLDMCREGDAYLHIGDMLESLCRQYFNRTNGEAFQFTATYFQQLYEFLGPEMPGVDTEVSAAAQDPGRARRVRGPNIVQVRGADDDAKYVAPDMSGAAVGLQATAAQRDAILRSTGHMALSQDTSGAMLRRSEGSKKQDATAQEVLLGAIGKRLLAAGQHAMVMLAEGRALGEESPALQGYQRFSIQDLDAMIEQALETESISIPSATYKKLKLYRLIRTDLGDDVPEEVMQTIREELDRAVTQDQYLVPIPAPGEPKDGKVGAQPEPEVEQ